MWARRPPDVVRQILALRRTCPHTKQHTNIQRMQWMLLSQQEVKVSPVKPAQSDFHPAVSLWHEMSKVSTYLNSPAPPSNIIAPPLPHHSHSSHQSQSYLKGLCPSDSCSYPPSPTFPWGAGKGRVQISSPCSPVHLPAPSMSIWLKVVTRGL